MSTKNSSRPTRTTKSRARANGSAGNQTSTAPATPKSQHKRVQFAFDAPNANDVAVTGTFCDWQTLYPLKQQKNGAWKRTLDIAPGRHEYRFVVDGEWRDDPRSSDRVPNPYGGMNSILETM